MMHTLPSIDGKHFDCVIIGAGMSGLAAGIRLAQFDKRVIILEKHNAPGGLNSFYSINGRKFDVGLHALTNYVEPGVKGTPLGKILRQLRIQRDEWDLHPQKKSVIRFTDAELGFTNDIEVLKHAIHQQFPKERDGFEKLIVTIQERNESEWLMIGGSARKMLREWIHDELLLEMLLCPVLFYGSAEENDMQWGGVCNFVSCNISRRTRQTL
jgi:phytoene dehydrogenase-like protein